MKNIFAVSIIVMFVFVINSFALDINNLLVYWACDEGAGDTLKDSSGNGWNATINEGDSEWVDGKFEKGIHLQGSYAQVDGAVIEPVGDTGEITLMLWFIMYQHSTYNGLISIEVPAGECCEFRLMVNPNKNPFWNMGHHVDKSLADFTFEMETWYHYAMTGAGKGGQIYVDGEFIGEQPEDFELGDYPEVTMYLGTGESPASWRVEDSTFDEVMVWNKALTADEIQEVMSGGLMAVEPANKLAYTWGSIKSE